jgi:hypothetical protein
MKSKADQMRMTACETRAARSQNRTSGAGQAHHKRGEQHELESHMRGNQEALARDPAPARLNEVGSTGPCGIHHAEFVKAAAKANERKPRTQRSQRENKIGHLRIMAELRGERGQKLGWYWKSQVSLSTSSRLLR